MSFLRGERPCGVSHLPSVLAVLLSCLLACDNTSGPSMSPPISTGCSRLGNYLHVVALARSPGAALDAAIVGSHVFNINSAGGLFAVDFSDPSDVRVVAALDTLRDARAIDSSGPWLFVANGDHGLSIVDVRNPAAPRIAKTLPMPGAMVDVRVRDKRAYLANDALGLVIVDISAPENAAVLGIENTPGHAVGVAPAGPLVLLAEAPSELRIVNVVDPAAPFVITRVAMPGHVESVDAGDNFGAVAVGQAGVQLVDTSHPSAPVLAGLIDTPVGAIGVALVDRTAFVSDANGGALMFDVKDIAHPTPIASLGTAAYTHRIRVFGDRLTIADDEAGVRVFDVRPPKPAPLETLVADGDIRSLATMGDLVVVADASFGLHVIDPVARSIVGEFPIAAVPKDVFVADSIAYVAPMFGNIAIVDMHDPASPVAAGEFGGGEIADHLAVAGNFGYLLQESGWLYEEPINPPGNARVFHDTFVQWGSVTVDRHFALGTILYVPNLRGTVLIIPASRMTPVNELPVAASPIRVAIRHYDGPFGPGTGTLAYVAEAGYANGQAGVEVFDTTDLNAPFLVGQFACAGNASDIAFTGTQIVVGEMEDGAEVFDLLDTARARPTGMMAAGVLRVAVSNGTLVAAGGKSGVLLLSLGKCLP